MTEAELNQITARGHVRIKGDLVAPSAPGVKAPAAKQIIRQSSKRPNKTETRFELDYLKPMRHTGEIGHYRFEAHTLKLANGLRYTPDWSAVNAAGKLVFWEVKGARIEEDAIVKFKTAPSSFPEHEFYLCQWKDGEWTIQKGLA